MDSKWLIGIALVVVVLALLLGAWMIDAYNGLVSSEQNVKEKWAQVQTQYQRRVDLIPNFVNTVKGAANFEQSTLTRITELRSQWQNASSEEEKVVAANGIESEFSRLLLIVENYPELTATQNFRDLQVELEGTENRIQFARSQFNEAVTQYNLRVKRIPGSWVAGMYGFVEKDFFAAETGSDEAPVVDFP